MGRVIISVAHSQLSGGARIRSLDLTEYEQSLEQSKLIAERLLQFGHHAEVFDCPRLAPGDYITHKLRRVNSSGPWALALEVHHNAGPIVNQYGLVIHHERSQAGAEAAKAINSQLEAILPWKCMARSSAWVRNNRQWFVNRTRCPAVLTEAGFYVDASGEEIDDESGISRPVPRDRQDYIDWLEQGGSELEALAIANGIHHYLKERQGHGATDTGSGDTAAVDASHSGGSGSSGIAGGYQGSIAEAVSNLADGEAGAGIRSHPPGAPLPDDGGGLPVDPDSAG